MGLGEGLVDSGSGVGGEGCSYYCCVQYMIAR